MKSISTRAWGAAVGLAAAVGVGGQSSALGGGVGWWSWEHGTIVVGEEATGVAAEVLFDSINQAEDAVRHSATESHVAQIKALERRDGRVRKLERRPAERIARPNPRTDRWVPLAWFALGGAVAAVAVTAFERRRESARPPRDAVNA